MKRLLMLTLLLAVAAPAAHARRIELFSAPGVPSADFYDLTHRVRAGDMLGLSGGDRRVVRRLGYGGTTFIFENERGRASRVPRGSTDGRFIDETVEGYRQLRALGIPLIRLYEDTHIPGEYVEVDLMPPDAQRLDKWLRQYNDCVENPAHCSAEQLREHAEKKDALLVFYAATAYVSHMADFRSEQIHWVGGRWLLTDWRLKHTMATHVYDNWPAARQEKGRMDSDEVKLYPWRLREEITQVVRAERQVRAHQGRFPRCPQLLK